MKDVAGVEVLPGDYVLWNGTERLVVNVGRHLIGFLKIASSWTSPDNPVAWWDCYDRNTLDGGLRVLRFGSRHSIALARWHRDWQERSEKNDVLRQRLRRENPGLAARYAREGVAERDREEASWRALAIQRARDRKTSGTRQRRSSR